VDVAVSLAINNEPSSDIIAELEVENSPSLPNDGWAITVNEGQSCLLALVESEQEPDPRYRLEYRFTVPSGVTHVYVFGEVDVNKSYNDDSFWIELNGTDRCNWNNLKPLGDGWKRSWVYNLGVDSQHEFSVSAGENVLYLYPREDDAYINWLIVTSDPNLDINGYQMGINVSKEMATSDIEFEPIIPTQFKLYQNYPNPFNSSTVVEYDLPDEYEVELKVYNLSGQLIRLLVSEIECAGIYRCEWDGLNDFGKQMSSGVYLYIMKAQNSHGSIVTTKKMLMIK
jgi:hypothetical protein